MINESTDDKILELASIYLKDLTRYYSVESLKIPRLLEAPYELRDLLLNNGFKEVHVVKGNFKVDKIFSYKNEDTFEPEHIWVEINGKVLDVTSKSFQLWVHTELPDIFFEYYSKLDRYIITKRKI